MGGNLGDNLAHAATTPVPAVVSLHIWGVSGQHVPAAMIHMARDRGPLLRLPGVQFAKLLGTGSARTFTPRDADFRHWGALICWSNPSGPFQLGDSKIGRSWTCIAEEYATWTMRPLSSKGRWARIEPFGSPAPVRWDGPVAAITRGRIKLRYWRRFWTATPPVALDMRADGGLTFAMGIGEAPVGLQGTFSTWRDSNALTDFAYRRSPHQSVIDQTTQHRWYAEEMFSRFALLSAEGTVAGQSVTPS